MIQHLPTPLGREAPPAILARLREVCPTTHLVYVGDGRWWLGRVWPSDDPRHAAKRREGVAMLDNMLALDPLRVGGASGRNRTRVLNALLRLHGFEWEREFTLRGEPDGALVEWWRAQHFLETTQRDATWQAAWREATGEARAERQRARVQEYVQAEAPSVHRHAFRRPIIST